MLYPVTAGEWIMRVAIALAVAAIVMVAVPGPGFASETITYTYDALGRLVTVAHSGTVNGNLQTVYTLDPADNRTNVTTTGATRRAAFWLGGQFRVISKSSH
jgi:hypothetical protein